MTYKDKMVLALLLYQRAKIKELMSHEDDIYRYDSLLSAYDAFSFAIGFLRCPLGILIKNYNQIQNGKSK